MSSTSRSLDNFQSLTNTNLGLEETRAESSETLIQSNLDAYILSNNAVIASAASATIATNSANTSALHTLTTSVATLQTQATADEGHSAAEVVRATGAESVLTTAVSAANTAHSTEVARALAAESANAQNITSNSTAIGTNIASIASLVASRTTDEASIASLVASRIIDESSITSLNASRAIDEANINVNYASVQTLNTAVASLNASRAIDEANINVNYASVQTLNSQVSAFGSAVTTTKVTAGSVITSLIENDTGALAFVTTHAQYGTSKLILADAAGAFGLTLDNSNSTADAADLIFKTSDASSRLRFCKGGDLVEQANTADGEMSANIDGVTSFYTGQFASGIRVGNFSVRAGNFAVPAGVVSDINDNDVTQSGTWANFGDYQSNMRFVRKGSVVCVSVSPFNCVPQSKLAASSYSMTIPTWAIPSVPVECCLVVATNGLSSAGCVYLNAQNKFAIFPFNGNWGTSGGLNQTSSFSYTI